MTEGLASPAFQNAIRNPDNPNHLMVIKPVPRRVRIYKDNLLLADSTNALRIMEVGKSVYDPVVYVPKADIAAKFVSLEKSTFCPVKGTATYIAIEGEEIGWTYETPIEMAEKLSGHVAFWPDKTRLTEG